MRTTDENDLREIRRKHAAAIAEAARVRRHKIIGMAISFACGAAAMALLWRYLA